MLPGSGAKGLSGITRTNKRSVIQQRPIFYLPRITFDYECLFAFEQEAHHLPVPAAYGARRSSC